MARITVDDCLQHINNRFELVLVATTRARKLAIGAVQPCLEWENDKSTVLALREIAAGYTFEEEVPEADLEITIPEPGFKPSGMETPAEPAAAAPATTDPFLPSTQSE